MNREEYDGYSEDVKWLYAGDTEEARAARRRAAPDADFRELCQMMEMCEEDEPGMLPLVPRWDADDDDYDPYEDDE